MNHPSPAVWFPAVRAGSGADVFTERLCAGLNACGIRAEITWLPLRAEYAPWSVPVPRPPHWANVVHVNSWLPPRFLPRDLPIVSTVHHCVHDPALAPYKGMARRLYHAVWIRQVETANLQYAQRRVAVSHYTAQQAKAAFGCADIAVIHNGVDTGRFRPIARSMPQRPFRLLYVGNWNPRKGVDLLGAVLAKLGDAFELHYTADRKGAHGRYALPRNSHHLGCLDTQALIAAYQNADALLFPSRLEGFGLVVAEAMACGLPVIATDTSALPELVKHGVTGMLCPKDDIAAFAAAARTLAEDLKLWQAMRQAARQRAEARFDERRQINHYIRLYQTLSY